MNEITIESYDRCYAWDEEELTVFNTKTGDTLTSDRGSQIFDEFFPLLQYAKVIREAAFDEVLERTIKGAVTILEGKLNQKEGFNERGK